MVSFARRSLGSLLQSLLFQKDLTGVYLSEAWCFVFERQVHKLE